MELKTVRKEMRAGDLKSIIDLPNYDDRQRVQVTVAPAAEKKILSDEEIDAIWSRIDACFEGVDVDTTKTLDDWRMERLEERYGIKFAD